MAKDFRRLPPNRLHWYNATDVVTTHAVTLAQRGVLGVFTDTWRNLWAPALDALGQVERWGALLDVEGVRRYDADLARRAAEKHAAFVHAHELPQSFNPRSSEQLADLLFGRLGMKPLAVSRKTGKPSTAEDVLVQLAERYPIRASLLNDLVDLRADLSARSRSGANLLRHVGYDGRVHTKYKVIRSGRLSSSDPNLQNLKSQEDEDAVDDPGRLARGCWIAPDGYVVLAGDYSQNELRFAAELSGDEKMAAALDSGDFHRATAQGIFGTDQIAKWQRRVGKETNFGVAFGQTDRGLAAKLNGLPSDARNGIVFTQQQCAKYIDGLLNTYSKFGRWRRMRMREARDTGQSFVSFGPYLHRRYLLDAGFPDTRANAKVLSHAANVAVNNPIQYTANLPGLVALIRVVAWILDSGVPAEVNLTVHDSLVLYVRRDVWPEVARHVRRIMLEAVPMRVARLKVDLEVGEHDYGAMRKVDLSD